MSRWVNNENTSIAKINTDFRISNNNILIQSTTASNVGFGTKESRNKGLGYFYFEANVNNSRGQNSIGLTQNSASFSYNGTGSTNYSEMINISNITNTVIGFLIDATDSTVVRFTTTINGSNWDNWKNLNKTLSSLYIGVVLINTNNSIDMTLNTGDSEFKYDLSSILRDIKDIKDIKDIYSFNGKRFFILSYEKMLLQSNNKIYSLESIDEIYETKMTSDTAPAPLKVIYNAGVSLSNYRYFGFDGKPNTFHWSSAITDNIYIGLDFGEPKVFNTLSLIDAPTGYENNTIKGFNIEASNDNLNYEILHSLPNHVSQGALATETFYFNNNKPYRYYRIRDNIKTNHAIAFTDLVFSKRKNILIEIPSVNKDIFTKYGKEKFDVSYSLIKNKNYILQDTVSENEQGLWTTQLDRKPLSIKFD